MYVRLVPIRMMGSRTHARTRAVFFGEGGFFGLFVFFGKRGGHMYVACRRRRRRERDDDDVFHVFEPGARAHVAEK